MGLNDQAFAARHRIAVSGQGRDGVAVLGEVLGPPCEHLSGADGVELLDTIEEQDADVVGVVGTLVQRAGSALLRSDMVAAVLRGNACFSITHV